MGRGVPVEMAEVIECAKRSHARCNGTGAVVWNESRRPCECATSRFMREHRHEVTVTDDGNVWWEAPTTGAVTAALVWFRSFFTAFFTRKSEG